MQIKKILGFAFGPVASSFLGLATIPMMAWTFNAEDIGRMNVFQIATSFVLLLSVLGLDQAYVREYHETKDKQQLLMTCFLPGFALLFLLLLPSLYYSSDLAHLLYDKYEPTWYWATFLAFFISYFSRFLSLVLRMEERGWAYSLSQVGPKVIQLALITILALTAFDKKFIHLQWITLASMIAVLFFYAWNTKTEWLPAASKNFNPPQFKSLMHFGFPLIFSGLAFWGLSATSTVALRSLSSLEELAVYSVANSFAAAALVFQSIFTVIWAPTVYKWKTQGADMAIVDKIGMQALAVVCAIVALSGCFGWVLDILLPDRYQSVKYIFLCMLIQPLLYTLSEITSIGIGIQRKTVFTVWITLFAMLFNWFLSYYLVPTHGAAGAAVANAIAFFAFFAARTEVSARIWRNFPRKKIYTSTLLCLIFVIANNAARSINIFYIYFAWFFVGIFVFFYFMPQWKQVFTLKYRVKGAS